MMEFLALFVFVVVIPHTGGCIVGCDCEIDAVINCLDSSLVSLEIEDGTFDSTKETIQASHNYLTSVNTTELKAAFPKLANIFLHKNSDFRCSSMPSDVTIFSDCPVFFSGMATTPVEMATEETVVESVEDPSPTTKEITKTSTSTTEMTTGKVFFEEATITAVRETTRHLTDLTVHSPTTDSILPRTHRKTELAATPEMTTVSAKGRRYLPKMIWQDYVNNSLLRTGSCTGAVIAGHDGNIWAEGGDIADRVTQDELTNISNGFNDPSSFQVNGVRVGGDRYIYLTSDGTVMHIKKDAGGAIIVKTGQALILATYNDAIQSGQCTAVAEKNLGTVAEQQTSTDKPEKEDELVYSVVGLVAVGVVVLAFYKACRRCRKSRGSYNVTEPKLSRIRPLDSSIQMLPLPEDFMNPFAGLPDTFPTPEGGNPFEDSVSVDSFKSLE